MTARIRHDDGGEYFFREGCHIAEWWNMPDDPAASVARARVAPGVSTRWHRLHEVAERYVILSGTGCVELGTGDARLSETVTTGSVVFIPPGVPQRITNLGSEDLVLLAVCTPRFTPGCYEDVEDEHARPT